MTRTEALIAALADELRGRSKEIDADDGLRSVSVTVKLSERTGKPAMILYRPESHRALNDRCEPRGLRPI
jgi:hypothetical protein